MPEKVLSIAGFSDYGGFSKWRQQGKDEEAGQLSSSSKAGCAPNPFLILLEANSQNGRLFLRWNWSPDRKRGGRKPSASFIRWKPPDFTNCTPRGQEHLWLWPWTRLAVFEDRDRSKQEGCEKPGEKQMLLLTFLLMEKCGFQIFHTNKCDVDTGKKNRPDD